MSIKNGNCRSGPPRNFSKSAPLKIAVLETRSEWLAFNFSATKWRRIHYYIFLQRPRFELVKKYQFLIQNRNKILKFKFFDNFSHIGGNIPWIFSVLRASTTILKIQNFFMPKFTVRKSRFFFSFFLRLHIRSINLRAGDF